VLDDNYRSLVTEDNLERLRGLPIFLFSGADNNVFKSTSTLKTYKFLKARGETVSWKEFPGFGHLDCWMSERSADTIYKAVEEEVRKVMVYADGTRN
jgi:predicted esterase